MKIYHILPNLVFDKGLSLKNHVSCFEGFDDFQLYAFEDF